MVRADENSGRPRALWRLLSLVALSYFVYALLLFLGQRQAVFPGQRLPAPPHPTVEGAEIYQLTTSVGLVEGWFLPSSSSHEGEGPRPAVLFFHGNYELVDHWLDDLQVARDRGFGVMAVEFPGYGRSEGRPSQRTTTEAAVAAYDSLLARPDVDGARVIAYGRSLGGGVATALARDRDLAALVLQSTFATLREMAKAFWVPALLVRDPFDNVAVLEQLEVPVLVLHGLNDDQIPTEHAHRLAAAAAQSRLILSDCRHDDCPASWDAFWDEIAAFVSMYQPPP